MHRSPLRWAVIVAVAAASVVGVTPVGRADPIGASAVEPAAGQYVPLDGGRVVADRSVAAGAVYSFSPLGVAGVPTSGVSAVAFSVTTRSEGSGHLIVYPAGTTQPGTSNLNYRPTVTTTNSVTVALGPDGQVSVYNGGTTHATTVTFDVYGYYTSAGSAAGSTYVPLAPTRLVNRVANAAGAALLVKPLGKGGVPTASVSAVAVSISVRGNNTVGAAGAYPEGITPPTFRAVSYQGDFVYTNQVVVKLGTGGGFRIPTTTATELYVDVVGYYQTASGTAAGSPLVTTPLTRLSPVIMEPGTTHTFSPLGQGGIPSSGVAGVLVNLTATQTTEAGVLIVYPAGTAQPNTTQLAFRTGGPWPALQRVKLGTNGQMSVANPSGSRVRLLIDLGGYYRSPGVPGTPTAVAATPGDGGAIVSWTPPASNGGANITAYRVTANPGGSTVDVVGRARSATLAGLTNGTAYTFTVAAVNGAGRSPASAASAAVTPRAATVPGAPAAVTATARYASVLVGWQRPADDGRLPITSYRVTASPGGAQVTVNAGTFEALVPNLTNGTAYTFTVTATNARGTGPAGTSPPAVRPGPSAPAAPSGVIAGATSNGQITVEWSPPSYDGGQPVTGYTVTASPGGRTVTAPADAIEADFTGLTSGSEYTFTVVARNANGAGPASTPTRPVTPDFGLKPGARELSAAALATLAAVEPTAVRFTNAPAEVTGLTAGAVLVVADPPAPHAPFLRRVSGVSTSGTTTTVTTTDATLVDAFTDGGFSLLAAVTDFKDDTVGIQAYDLTETIPINEELAPGVRLTGALTDQSSIIFDVDLSGTMKLTVERIWTMQLTIKADVVARDFPERPKELKKGKIDVKKKAGRLAKLVRPSLDSEWLVYGRGSVNAGAQASVTTRTGIRYVVDFMARENSQTIEHVNEREVEVPTTSASVDVYVGLRQNLLAGAFGFEVGKVKADQEVHFNINPLADNWASAELCSVVGVETFKVAGFGIPYKDPELIKKCWNLLGFLGRTFNLTVVPDGLRIPRNVTIQMAAAGNFLGGGTVEWVVQGTGNGTVEPRSDPMTALYTAPNKDGLFVITVTIPASGIRPKQQGTALIWVGPAVQ